MEMNGKREDRIILAANGSHAAGHASHQQDISSMAPSSKQSQGNKTSFALVGGILLLLGAAGGIGAWTFWHERPVPMAATAEPRKILSYGEPGKVHFRTSEVQAGEKTGICFDSVVWHEICRSEMVFNVTCYKKIPGSAANLAELARTDYPVYQISVPQQTGPVTPKCRPFTIPEDCLPGPLTHSGFVRHECGPDNKRETLYTPVPTFSTEIKP